MPFYDIVNAQTTEPSLYSLLSLVYVVPVWKLTVSAGLNKSDLMYFMYIKSFVFNTTYISYLCRRAFWVCNYLGMIIMWSKYDLTID